MKENYTDLRARVRSIAQGAPVGTLTYTGGRHARDERGAIFHVQSIEEIERRRFFAQLKEGRKAAFTFNNMELMKYVGQTLTAAQCGYLLVLASYTNYNGLLVRSERDHTPMNQRDIREVLGLKPTQKSTVSDFITTALNYGIMHQDDRGLWIAQGIHFKGRNQDGADVVRAYIAQLRKLAATNKPEHIGFIYKLLPYMHKTTNMLCHNPNEADTGLLKKLKRDDLATIAGVNVSYISRVTKALEIEGRSVFAKITTSHGTAYMLNPAIFRRSDHAHYDDTVRAIFDIK